MNLAGHVTETADKTGRSHQNIARLKESEVLCRRKDEAQNKVHDFFEATDAKILIDMSTRHDHGSDARLASMYSRRLTLSEKFIEESSLPDIS